MSSSSSSVTLSQTNRPARTTSGMTIIAARVTASATATVLRAFMGTSCCWVGMGGGSGCCGCGLATAGFGGLLVSERGAAGDHRGDVLAGELGEDVLAAGLCCHEQPDD